MAGVAQALDIADLPGWANRKAEDIAHLDMTPALKTVSVMLSAEYKSNFDESHGPDGIPWLPLKHPRANSKGGDKVLRDKGLLMASGTAGATGHVQIVEAWQLIWGTNLVCAAVHQYGHTFNVPTRYRPPHLKPWVFTADDGRKIFTRKIKGHTWLLPARPFVGWSTHATEQAGLILGDFWERAVA
jgi:phage gpG-like protein